MNCPYKWANSIDEEEDQTSSWESEPEGENAEELARLETPDEDVSGAGQRRAESPGGKGGLTRDQHSTASLETMQVSKRPEDWITWSHETPEERSRRETRSPWWSTREQQTMWCRGACFPR